MTTVPPGAAAVNLCIVPLLRQPSGVPTYVSVDGAWFANYTLAAAASRSSNGTLRVSFSTPSPRYRLNFGEVEPDDYIHLWFWQFSNANQTLRVTAGVDGSSQFYHDARYQGGTSRSWQRHSVTIPPNPNLTPENLVQLHWRNVLSSDGESELAAVRIAVSKSPEPDDYGLFCGSGHVGANSSGQPQLQGYPSSGSLESQWLGASWLSESYITDSDLEPEPEPVEVTATPPQWIDNTDDGGGTWTTPTLEGIAYTPASGTATPGETITITATALEGYTLIGQTQWQHTFPVEPEPEEPEPEEPEPELPPPDPEPELPPPDPELELGEDMIQQLAERVAAYMGEPDDEGLIATAKSHVPSVVAFVKGYTRGRGFSDVGVPESQLVHVIISSCARLTSNPEQFSYFQALDFSVRPSVFNGWTLPELAVLNQYRQRWA